MNNSFTTFWSQDRCQEIKKHHLLDADTPLTILFGGPHTSLPGFRRAGVRDGDYIYPIRVQNGILYVLGRMRVKRILALEEYIQQNPRLFEGCTGPSPAITLTNYLVHHPEMYYLAPTCVEEVVLGEEGTPIRLISQFPWGRRAIAFSLAEEGTRDQASRKRQDKKMLSLQAFIVWAAICPRS
jgi:hypothetical protein